MNTSPFRAVSSALLASVAVCGCASPLDRTPDYYYDDRVITLKVETALLNEPSLQAYGVGVATADRVVQLSGFVSSEPEIHRASEIARTVGGVQSVESNVQLRPD